MARRKPDRSPEPGKRRAETNAVAAYLTALRAPKVPARNRANLERRRAQVEQWIADESPPIREVDLIQQPLDIDAQLAQNRPGRPLAAVLRGVGVQACVLANAGL
jgi:hypothetical protein